MNLLHTGVVTEVPEYTLEASDKTERGSEIILHIAEDSAEFLEESRITSLIEQIQ